MAPSKISVFKTSLEVPALLLLSHYRQIPHWQSWEDFAQD